MKKFCLIFCLLFTLCFVGCSDVGTESTYVLPGGIASDGGTHSNETLAIYGGDGEQIGKLEQYDIIAQTQGSIIYSKVPKESEKKLKKLDLYRYMVDTGENIKLGTVKRWVTQVADPVEADGHLYLLAETGNLFHKYGYFGLFDIDLGENKLTKLQSGKGARYHSMAVAEDQILLAKEDRIEAYDRNTEEMKTMLKADLDEESYRGEHLRKIFSDEEGIVVLKFVDTEGLLMERYDSELHLTETKNLSTLLPDAVDETASTRRFAYVKQYLFYESFAQACFLGIVEGETATDLIEGELCCYLSMAESAAEKQDSILLYCWMNSEDAYSDLYLLDCNNGSLKKADFTPATGYDHISNVYRDAEGHALLCTEDTLYYLTLSELNFTSCQ